MNTCRCLPISDALCFFDENHTATDSVIANPEPHYMVFAAFAVMKRNLLATAPAAQSHDAESALRSAMDRFGSYLLWYLQDCCGDRHEAENIFQQLWLHVYQKFPVEKYEHLPLLRRKAYQLYVDHVRSRSVRGFVSYTETLPEPEPASFYAEPATDAEEAQFKERFWETFSELDLPEIQREAFWLHCRHGYAIAEVAQKLNAATSTVHDWVKTVKARCGEYLNQESAT